MGLLAEEKKAEDGGGCFKLDYGRLRLVHSPQ